VSGAVGQAGSFTTLGLQGSLVWVVNVPDCEGSQGRNCWVVAFIFYRNIVSSDVETISSGIGSISSHVETISSEIGGISSDVESISSGIGSISSDVGGISSVRSPISSEIGSISTEINSISEDSFSPYFTSISN